MKYTQSSVSLFLFLIFSTGLLASKFEQLPDCQVMQLNQTMRSKLDIPQEQMSAIQQLNQRYCLSRQQILDNPDKVGKNTALLACWDKWSQGLSLVLTDTQMQTFIQWQSQVDLVGESPF